MYEDIIIDDPIAVFGVRETGQAIIATIPSFLGKLILDTVHPLEAARGLSSIG